MTIVVKVGGALGNALDGVLDDLASRRDFVLVHGGSNEVDRLGEALGRPSEYYTSPSGVVSRRSTPDHLEVVTLALAGKVQTEIVRALEQRGTPAVGLSGVDGRLLLARRKEGAREVVDGRTLRVANDFAGSVEAVNAQLLDVLLHSGFAPVVGPPAITADGEVVNVDADRVAAQVAIAVRAEALLLLTNVPGLLRDPDDPASVVPRASLERFDEFLALAKGRMRKKLLAAREAREGGVGRVVIASSAGANPVVAALRGGGTAVE
ncbi:MAG TPA: [LysW]-aminoadipate kinase [Thermoplasmata archaeon]|jgi:acetylglutamate/LysW-gamma-L-alpha-aminoadipate kinase|nr:[LysW]-aminoadipate kinase [Thermoplasmata archaeon]